MFNHKKKGSDGFQHWDLVKSLHRTKDVVVGAVKSLKKNYMTIRTTFDDNFPVSYKKSKLLWKFNGLVYLVI